MHIRLACAALTASAAALPAQSKLLRFPDLHGARIVFTHGGDLWLAPAAGGTATRLTSAHGIEQFAKFSPDGRWIAFTGQIDGDEQVYVVPSEGGEPRQLTFYPAMGPLPDRWGHDNQVLGWTPDGQSVLFRGLRESWSPARGRLYTVALPTAARTRGALPVPLPMPVSGAGEFSPDGNLLVHSPLARDFRTWKRYAGGWAQDLYVFAPGTGTAENVTDHPRTDRDPMWIGNRIWFASDRSGTLNLWSYDPQSRRTEQETFSSSWDVRWPSAAGPGDERVVYEKGGELFVYDCKSRTEQAIAIRVPDEALLRRAAIVDARQRIEDVALSPGGRRIAVAARGDVLTVPKEHGDVRNLTATPGAHDRLPAFSPDGARVAFVSDRGGDEQIWLVAHDGGAATELTPRLGARIDALWWSPDGRTIAFADKDGVLRTVAIDGGEIVQVADERGQLEEVAWSPCSGWLAFALTMDNDLSAIHLWSMADRTLTRVSRPLANDRAPCFDARGERLFFLGLRGFAPRLPEAYEWDFQVARSWGVFALALRKDLRPWLDKRSDEADAAPPEPAPAPKFDAPIAIDLDGLAARVEPVPVPFEDWRWLRAVPEGLLLVRGGTQFYGRKAEPEPTLAFFDRKERKLTDVTAGVERLALSPDAAHLLTVTGDGIRVAAADGKAGAATARKWPELSVPRVPADEWWQIFHEVWRRYRDFFYVANMHGYDWEALRERYAPLVAHVRHRSDLNYVLGEMVAELNVGHAYVSGGDVDEPAREPVALLGAVLRFDPAAGRYRIAQLLRGENDDPVYRSPLTAIGVDVAEGDWLLAIDGVELSPEVNPYRLLRQKTGRTVRLLVHAQPTMQGAREVAIEGIASEGKLCYHAWVEKNRARVDRLSNGRYGYLHLPDMGADGIREFVRQYYPQRDKDGLVIDVRGNGGGNVSQMVLNRLQRELLMCTFGRTTGFRPYPIATFLGRLVCVLDETSASDGDIFPAMFRRAGLGKLVGKRSWGGIIGITDRGPLLDGGTVNVPEFGNTEPGGEWTIEGVGVEPDVVVENDVQALLKGRDPQLEKAVEILREELRARPALRPEPPPPPVRTGR